MKRFYLQRKADVSGVSGTGNVAEGVQFDNGKATMCWLSKRLTISVFDSVEELVELHGHEGNTELVWIDDASSNMVVDKNSCHCEISDSVYDDVNPDYFAPTLLKSAQLKLENEAILDQHKKLGDRYHVVLNERNDLKQRHEELLERAKNASRSELEEYLYDLEHHDEVESNL